MLGKRTIRPDSNYTLVYSDNGVGISLEDLQNVFVEGNSKKEGHLRMAMSYWREYLNLFDTLISVESAEGNGTSFIINIPPSLIAK